MRPGADAARSRRSPRPRRARRATARQSRRPIMYAAIPITSWGLAIAAVNPSANPAAPGLSRRQSGVGGSQPEDGDTVPLTLEEEQPGPEAGERDQHDRHPRQSWQRRRPRCGASHQQERERHERAAGAATRRARRRRRSSSVNGSATTAAAGGFSNGMSSWLGRRAARRPAPRRSAAGVVDLHGVSRADQRRGDVGPGEVAGRRKRCGHDRPDLRVVGKDDRGDGDEGGGEPPRAFGQGAAHSMATPPTPPSSGRHRALANTSRSASEKSANVISRKGGLRRPRALPLRLLIAIGAASSIGNP